MNFHELQAVMSSQLSRASVMMATDLVRYQANIFTKNNRIAKKVMNIWMRKFCLTVFKIGYLRGEVTTICF